MSRESYVKVLRGLALAGVVAALLYAFAPQTGNRLGSVKAPEARKPMPHFNLPVLGGGEWNLAENRGKVVLVNFWATWCPPCREETPALVKLADRYRQHGFEIAAISMDDDPKEAVPPFASRYRMSYPVLMPTADSAIAAAIESLPTSVLVDKQGRIARSFIGAVDERDIEDDIRLLLAE